MDGDEWTKFRGCRVVIEDVIVVRCKREQRFEWIVISRMAMMKFMTTVETRSWTTKDGRAMAIDEKDGRWNGQDTISSTKRTERRYARR